MRVLNVLTLNEYNRLVEESTIIEQDRNGIKVLETPDGRFIKFFRLKRIISSAIFKSYASRFVENARTLKKLGINTVQVEEVSYCKSIKRTLVFYQPMPGKTLRRLLEDQVDSDEIMEKFADFLAMLHDKGVFFRSIHLSNVIVSGDSTTMGLIDIADMKIYPKSLSNKMRMRNFRHLTRYGVDQASIKSFGVDRFMDKYFELSQLPEQCKQDFVTGMWQLMEEGGKE